jgi:hypothetical protein
MWLTWHWYGHRLVGPCGGLQFGMLLLVGGFLGSWALFRAGGRDGPGAGSVGSMRACTISKVIFFGHCS